MLNWTLFSVLFVQGYFTSNKRSLLLFRTTKTGIINYFYRSLWMLFIDSRCILCCIVKHKHGRKVLLVNPESHSSNSFQHLYYKWISWNLSGWSLFHNYILCSAREQMLFYFLYYIVTQPHLITLNSISWSVMPRTSN